jgi:hypothetical protein
MKKILVLSCITVALAGTVWIVKGLFRADHDELIRSDHAISRMRSWRLRLEPTSPKIPKEWIVIEAIPPDREHGWQHVDSTVTTINSEKKRITGNLEYIRIGDDRYFRGDAMSNHAAAPQWIKLSPRDHHPLAGFGNLRFGLSNPRSIESDFQSVDSLWSNYHRVDMRLGGFTTYSGRTCREWTYDWLAKDLPMHDTLCIGTSDHLPYHLTTSGGWAQATYEWNPSVSIEVPKFILPRPEDFSVVGRDPASRH